MTSGHCSFVQLLSQWSLPPLEIDEHLSSQCSSFVIGSDWQQCMTGHLALAPVTVLIGAPTALSSGLAPAIVHSDHSELYSANKPVNSDQHCVSEDCTLSNYQVNVIEMVRDLLFLFSAGGCRGACRSRCWKIADWRWSICHSVRLCVCAYAAIVAPSTPLTFTVQSLSTLETETFSHSWSHIGSHTFTYDHLSLPFYLAAPFATFVFSTTLFCFFYSFLLFFSLPLFSSIFAALSARARIRVYCRRGANEENANEEMSARLGRHWIDDNGNGGNGLWCLWGEQTWSACWRLCRCALLLQSLSQSVSHIHLQTHKHTLKSGDKW